VATIGLSIWLAWSRLEFRTQRDDLMAADKACQLRWRACLAEFGPDDDIVFVIEGSGRERMIEAVQALAIELRAKPDKFDRVFESVDLRALHDRAILYLSADEIRAVEARLDEQAPLLGAAASLAWQGLTLDNLLARAETILAARQRGETLSETDLAYLRLITAILASAEQWLRGSDGFINPWATSGRASKDIEALERPRYFFSDDGSMVMLLARPAHPDRQSFTPMAESVGAAREIVARVRQRFPDLQFGLTGLPVLEHDEMAGTDRDSMRAAWLALAAVAVLYFFVYRSWRYPLLTVGSLAAGTVWALGLTTVTVGHLNILSSAFAVMLIGIGDYGVLWVARFDELRRAGRNFEDAMRHTAMHAGPSIVTAALTTSLAFYATILADFQAVAELGFIAGSGVLLCALACLTLIPALQAILNRRRPAPTAAIPLHWSNPSRPMLTRATRRPVIVIFVAAAIAAVCAPLAFGIRYDDNLLHLQSTQNDAVRWEMKLLQRTGGGGWSVLSVADSPEQAIALRAKYEQLAEVGRVEEIATLVPADQERKLPIVERIATRLQTLPPRGQSTVHPPTSADVLRRRVGRFIDASETEPALHHGALSFRSAMDESSKFQGRLGSFEQRLREALWDDLNTLRQTATAQPITLTDLPVALRERFIGKTDKWLVRASARHDVWDNDALGRFVAQTRTVDPEATGKPFGTYEGLRALKHGFLWAGLYALLAIVAVLIADFRKARDVLLGLLPLALGIVLSMALLRLFDVPLNPANMIVLPLIVGVGVDNGVHILHDYRSRAHGAPYRLSSAAGGGILVAALTTILGFSTLMISRHQGMRSLGFALALGVTCCMFAALLVLPAVLSVIDRRAKPREPKSSGEMQRAA
jgi:hopanoid biosynthesis associated RND transporter like protein HpnN